MLEQVENPKATTNKLGVEFCWGKKPGEPGTTTLNPRESISPSPPLALQWPL